MLPNGFFLLTRSVRYRRSADLCSVLPKYHLNIWTDHRHISLAKIDCGSERHVGSGVWKGEAPSYKHWCLDESSQSMRVNTISLLPFVEPVGNSTILAIGEGSYLMSMRGRSILYNSCQSQLWVEEKKKPLALFLFYSALKTMRKCCSSIHHFTSLHHLPVLAPLDPSCTASFSSKILLMDLAVVQMTS